MLGIFSYFLEASIAHINTSATKTIMEISNTMSSISSLEGKALDLTTSVNNWNRVYLWALAIALLSGAFSFWAQRQAISKSRELVTTANELSHEKDRQLQLDLKSKDEQIAKTNERAQQLEKEAAELRLLSTWRSLSKEQSDTLTKALSAHPSRLRLVSVAGDPEALFFSIQLSRAFNGWTLYPTIRSYVRFLPVGIRILGDSDEEVSVVRGAFTAADIPFSPNPIQASDSIGTDLSDAEVGPAGEPHVTIIVGSKSRPEFENVAK